MQSRLAELFQMSPSDLYLNSYSVDEFILVLMILYVLTLRDSKLFFNKRKMLRLREIKYHKS